ncbi:DUF6907 domain-containing protein [Streptomyces sp. NPDC059569]|uniref:DUF6907 domain-containing protein n=1 Tax=Streptomyces sp. NPDC059569 TaxID=3346869 RepID=UPI0036BE2AED
MTTVMPERQVVSFSPAAPLFHCPTWCLGGHNAEYAAQTGVLTHLSTEYFLPNPKPLSETAETVLRVALIRTDSQTEKGRAKFYLCGESEVEVTASEAEIFLAQLEAFTSVASILRSQMGATL